MDTTISAPASDLGRRRAVPAPVADTSRPTAGAVSWGAIAAGAAAAAALSLILLILGVGLGLSAVSPWARDGVNAVTFGVSTILWVTLTQLLASAMGGYLAGRLRTRWTEVHADEVYFRDTAHGFLAWAIASLVTAAMLASAIGAILGSSAQAAASMTGGAAASAMARLAPAAGQGPTGYFVDTLFRPDAATAPPAGTEVTDRTSSRDDAEIGRIFMNLGLAEPLPPADISRVAQIVAQRTGLSQQDAEKRVIDVYARAQTRLRDAEVTARAAADKARKASAYSALWLFVSLLIGAFVASLSATYGGRRRDA
jgi:hypothetical protein